MDDNVRRECGRFILWAMDFALSDDKTCAATLVSASEKPTFKTAAMELEKWLEHTRKLEKGGAAGGKATTDAKREAARLNATRPRPNRRKPKPDQAG